MKRSISYIILLIILVTFVFSACHKEKEKDSVDITATGNTPIPSEDEFAPEDTGKENENSELQEDKGTYDLNFELLIEAETADYAGKVHEDSIKDGFTGSGYLIGIEGPDDIITFTIIVPGNGAYDLNFISASYSGYKENNILVDGEMIGVAKVDGSEFTDSMVERVYLTTGEHEIQMRKSWGWIYLDALKVTTSPPADFTIYNVSSNLVDPKASVSTKRLMHYLTDMYGKYIISGQYANMGTNSSEFKAINNVSGKFPAMLGLDFIEYTPSRAANGSIGKTVKYAIEFDQLGGIVTFCWHWNAPEPYLYDTKDIPWWKGFYANATNINLKKIMDGEDQEGFDLLIRDIDAIAEQLKILQKADVPILWRPLHEASGGWFWWGTSGPEAYIKLYQLLYNRLTNHHDIHNLIWVWNGQDQDWYPGDSYVDIVGTDIYPGEKVYTSQVSRFNELVKWNRGNNKIVALTENGCMFDPDLAFRDNAVWSYFGTWEGDFITLNGSYTLSQKYTETEMLNKVYNHEKVVTLDELPNLKTYGD